jgi:SAM-dependent methyltransferase
LRATALTEGKGVVKTSWSISSFEDPARHAEIAAIVRRNSTNHADVREAALSGLDLTACRAILDLGCGFGFMTEMVAPRCAEDAHIVGVDACAGNERPYLQCLERAGRTGRFVCSRIDDKIDWPDQAFDLVVASYSLYFFPQVIPEIARVLAPQGVFIALTHSEESVRDLLRMFGAREGYSSLLPLSRNFSAENGQRLLGSRFSEVERIEYPNTLVFDADHKEDLFTYLCFKLPFMYPASESRDTPTRLRESARTALGRRQQVILAKDDAVFRCRKPVIP